MSRRERRGIDVCDQTFMLKVISATLICMVLALTLSAHAVLLEATPAAHAFLKGPAVTVHLRFNSRVDAGRSSLSLVLPNQTARVLAIGRQTSPDTLDAQAAGLPSGQYRLRWQVLAADGHITRGEIPFEVR